MVFIIQDWVAQIMVSFNHWLSSVKTNTLSKYWTLVNANHASSNLAQCVKGIHVIPWSTGLILNELINV